MPHRIRSLLLSLLMLLHSLVSVAFEQITYFSLRQTPWLLMWHCLLLEWNLAVSS